MSAPPFALEWRHTIEDHVDVLTFQIDRIKNHGFQRQASRRRWIIHALPLLIFAMFMLAPGGRLAGAIGLGIYLVILVIFTLVGKLIAGPYDASANARRKAEAFARQEPFKPIGTHTLVFEDGLLTWSWLDGEEMTAYPAGVIDETREAYGRLFLLRAGDLRGSVPVRAFRDAEHKQAFTDAIEDAFEARSAREHAETPETAHP